jgi:hypothetical protein
MWTLQRACDVQVTQAALGPCHPREPKPWHARPHTTALQFDARFGAGQDVFDALVRQAWTALIRQLQKLELTIDSYCQRHV